MIAITARSFAAVLLDSQSDAVAGAQLRTLSRQALIPLAIAGGLLTLWALTAPLSGAIVAVGKLKVELNRKTVQHQEGGIIPYLKKHGLSALEDLEKF